MRISEFDWDEHNLLHIARHRVTPSEAEDICRSHRLVLRTKAGRYVVFGQTATGQYLLVVLKKMGAQLVRVITARAMTDQEKRLYRRSLS